MERDSSRMERSRRHSEAEKALYRRRRALALLPVAILAAIVAALLTMTAERSDPQESPITITSSTADLDPLAEETPSIEWISVGRGARGARVVRQEGAEGGRLVILFHGWKVASRGDYRKWISHLARAGNTVIFPTYQSTTTPPAEVLGNALSGIRSAIEVVGEGDYLVAAGHSAGAALAADYAAVAGQRGLPVPAAVLAIYPGRAILGYPEGIPQADLTRIDPSTRLVAMSSPSDTIVGEQPAQDLLAAAASVPASRKRLVSVTSPKAGDHYAPAESSAAARRTFWRALDRLLARS